MDGPDSNEGCSREGELLALTPEDIDLQKGLIRVNRTYSRANARDVVTPPKTPRSVRTVAISASLTACLAVYMQHHGPENAVMRLFPYTKHYLYKYLKKGALQG